ncbi:MAG: winged helix-turn-helix transcriptional regulator, partial [Paracoccaceae bacterium]
MESTTIDPFDVQILRALAEDGRMTVQNLSDRVGLSPSPVARRLNRLEKDGYIKGYAALIDEARVGFGISVC